MIIININISLFFIYLYLKMTFHQYNLLFLNKLNKIIKYFFFKKPIKN